MGSENDSQQKYVELIDRLQSLSSEVDWCEFKVNNSDPERIGKYISAVANAALYCDEPFGYVVWGVEDTTHRIVGTSFDPGSALYGAQPLEFWLSREIKPSTTFKFRIMERDGLRVVVLEIPAARDITVKFKDIAYIRISSATPKLSDHPGIEARIVSKLKRVIWESGIALGDLEYKHLLQLLDIKRYCHLLGYQWSDADASVVDYLLDDRVICNDGRARFSITNLGAILFAINLADFSAIRRKSPRVVMYKGRSRVETQSEQLGKRGYALGYPGIVQYVTKVLPRNEEIVKALRQEKAVYPDIAIRELIANALIHQDMTIDGAGPMIEIFKDRIEITNPGQPLVDTKRLMDMPPRSRNENIAYLMRRMKMCEEMGSGIDKVILNVELYQLPPPDFRIDGENFRVILFAPRAFKDMDGEQRIRAGAYPFDSGYAICSV
jgi:ATP-dependent DNA helicase RecG